MNFNKTILLIGFILTGCASKRQYAVWKPLANENADLQVVAEQLNVIRPGIPAVDSTVLLYKSNGTPALKISFSTPVIVTKATEPQEWGNYQFPGLTFTTDGQLVVKTHMSPDAVASYGRTRYIYSYSSDHGKTWQSETSSDPAKDNGVAEGVLLPNGDRLRIVTPTSINEKDLKLPPPVAVDGNKKFYKLIDLPESRQGVFLSRMRKGSSVWENEKGILNDPRALRYTWKGEMPVVWWGDMKMLPDGSLVAGVYPSYYLNNSNGTDMKSAVFFYRSIDDGKTWNIQGRILYQPDPKLQPLNEGGFTEPAFEILKDGTFLCVMRTTDNENGPMYQSQSNDNGKTWTVPKVIAPAGVLPRLLNLENGVTVLSSGRPGVQLRFSLNSQTWTTPFEMLHYTPIKPVDWFTTCGYTNLLPAGQNSFWIVYSDFFTMNERGQMRKSIKFRKVTVDIQ